MKKITLFAAFLVAFAFQGNAQTTMTLVSPTGDGGFETADTFEGNGWTLLNHTYGSRKWQIGTGQAGFSGTRGAFIGSSATTVGTTAGSRTVHIYRPVTIPAGATNVQVKFKYKQEVVVIDPATGPNDYVYLSLMTEAPTNGTAAVRFSDKFPSTAAAYPSYTQITAPVPESAIVAGTTQYLVVTFRSTNLNDPATIGWGAIDDIEMTYEAALGTEEFNTNKIAAYPNPVKDKLTITAAENIDSVSIFNLFGQKLLNQEINATEAAIDMSALATGTYIVNVQSDKNTKTIKIVK
jgi:hypothetical protein